MKGDKFFGGLVNTGSLKITWKNSGCFYLLYFIFPVKLGFYNVTKKDWDWYITLSV